jgi:hypothetical protein
MADKFTKQIIGEVKCVEYCTVIVDSTPDISYVDELAVTLRYVKEDGEPVERFLLFLPSEGHKSEQLPH